MKPIRAFASLAVGLIFLVLVFAFTFRFRGSLFGVYPGDADGFWRINSMYVLRAVRNWLIWGAWKLGFRAYFVQIIDAARNTTTPYYSYPWLYLLLPWSLSAGFGIPLTMKLLNVLSLGAHLGMALGSLLFVRALARRTGAGGAEATLYGTVCGSLLLLFPTHVAYFQQWWPDIAVLPFYAFLLWLEVEAPNLRGRAWFSVLYATTAWLAMFSDWLAFLLVAAILIKRHFDSDHPLERRHRAELFAPAALVVGFHLAMLSHSRGFATLFAKFLERSGRGNTHAFFDPVQLRQGFGSAGLPLFFASVILLPLAFFVFRRSKQKEYRVFAGAMFMAIAPLFAHYLIVHQHYFDHPYEWLKFGFAASLVPFAAIPLALALYTRQRAAIAALTVAAAFYFVSTFPLLYNFYLGGPRNLSPLNTARCQALAESARGYEVLVSPQFATVNSIPSDEDGFKAIGFGVPWSCFQTIEYAGTPEELRLVITLGFWRASFQKGDWRMLVVFTGAPPAIWRPFIKPVTLRHAADLELYELEASAFPLP